MTMTAHTPGPWQAATIEGDEYAFVEPADNSSDNDNANYVIARCSGPDRIENAILLAAAPELLRVLKTLELLLRDRSETSHLLNVALEQAREAIALAQGQ